MRAALLLIGLLLLTGCATVNPETGEPQGLPQILVLDLDAAYQIAVAHNDTLAMMCFPVLQKYIGTSTPSMDHVKGLISAWEKARVTRIAIEGRMGGVSVELQAACGGLLLSEREFLARLAIFGAVGVK